MSWYKSLAGSMVKYGAKALAGVVPFGEVMLDVAQDLWAKYRKPREQGNAPNLVVDLQAAALPAPAADVQREIAAAVEDAAAGQPPEVKLALTSYLAQAPFAIRRSLRRPSDPSGTTVPATLALQQARDLVPFLPTALPRFKAGDRPLPGVPKVLREMLGKGGFGEVWLASHPRDDTLVTALKFCLDEKAANSLRHEAKALARVRREGKHAGIVELREVWDENEPLCLEYEYVEGGDLSGLIREMHAAGSPKPDDVARWLLNLLEPIGFVHSLKPPIVHRDLKPANILVERQKDGAFRLRVADFGISDVAAREALRETGGQSLMTVGVGGFTALYASPQQINNDPADPRDDIHALGVIWLQMLTGDLNRGRPAGSSWKIPLRARGMTEPMLELLELCVDDVAAVRPADATDLATRLKATLGGKPVIPAPKPIEKPEAQREIVNAIGMKLMLIPAGTFLMGSPNGEKDSSDGEHPQHQVEISRPFYLGAFQVTQEQYQRVMGKNPSHFCASGGGKDKVASLDTKRFPVESVSWDEAQEFCQRLSNLPEEKKAGRVYRLPTEAEWEYSCRGGATSYSPFSFGDSLTSSQANFNGNYPYGNGKKGRCLERPSPVGSFPANAFGLFDMHGNVWEWCGDWHDDNYYENSPKIDPQGSGDGTCRLLRGGSWFNFGSYCRSAFRSWIAPGDRNISCGFRVCVG